ncbi:Leucine Rich repeat [Leishmania donovani]|uniref:Leucine Rich repeat family protein n=1 Tax=Leishmania donovani TaxID=5661 RepID=A0A504XEF3_LEIDO|nr:Leucine Rich repeat family protein [Leishmania donovani]CAJ1992596.1 Leucine Rich repeat [Leishmania donovani]VDZ48429.1 Leucine_Rich_repeat_putative/Pfam:PF13516 [Leishmania donovani]
MPGSLKVQTGRSDARKTVKKTVPSKGNIARSDEPAGAAHSAASASVATSSATTASTLTNAVALSTSEQERPVEAVKATIPASASREVLRKDPIYRIMHILPRSDVLEVVRSRFEKPHCERAAAYFDLSYMKNPLRHLRLQLGCDGPTGIYLFFRRIAAHRHTLRVVDFSRNRLSADDAVLLCNTLGLGVAGDAATAPGITKASSPGAAADSTVSTAAGASAQSSSSLELLDLSYNAKLGNDGAVHVVAAVRRLPSIRAVILKSVGIDDDGAIAVADVVRCWPAPAVCASSATPHALLRPATASATKFYLNLNENYIGARGTDVLGKGLPHYVSLTLAKQRPDPARSRKRSRDDDGAARR